MPGYIQLVKFTPQGTTSVKQGPDRMNQVKAIAQEAGVRHVGTWVTMGQYDLVAIWDAPDDQAMAAFALRVLSLGFGSAQTMRALSEEEFAQVVAKLP